VWSINACAMEFCPDTKWKRYENDCNAQIARTKYMFMGRYAVMHDVALTTYRLIGAGRSVHVSHFWILNAEAEGAKLGC
jgi:hypothetical protein